MFVSSGMGFPYFYWPNQLMINNGDRSKVDRIEIRWPRGIVQTLENPAINTVNQIREPAQ